MNKFDSKVNYILNEFLSSVLQNVNSFNQAIGTNGSGEARNAAFANAFGKTPEKNGKKNPNVYSKENKPNPNETAVWNKNPQYKAKVVKSLDQNGNYGITPIGYVFVKTVSDPNKWIPANKTDINFNYMTYKNAAIAQEVQGNTKIPQICPKQQVGNQMVGVDYILVGNTKTDMDQWIKEDVYNNSQQPQQQQPQQQQPQQQQQQPQQKQPQSKPKTPRSPSAPRITAQTTT
jgi:hypothetical protein